MPSTRSGVFSGVFQVPNCVSTVGMWNCPPGTERVAQCLAFVMLDPKQAIAVSTWIRSVALSSRTLLDGARLPDLGLTAVCRCHAAATHVELDGRSEFGAEVAG
jgi:hypothetical protein